MARAKGPTLTPARALQALKSNGGKVKAAAVALGVWPTTLTTFAKKHPEVQAAIAPAEQSPKRGRKKKEEEAQPAKPVETPPVSEPDPKPDPKTPKRKKADPPDVGTKKKTEEQPETKKEKAPRKKRLTLAMTEEKLMELIEAGDRQAIIFFLSTKGKKSGYAYAKSVSVPVSTSEQRKKKDIIQRLMKEKITVVHAALEFEMAGIPIPDTISIMLAKAEQPSGDPTEGYSVFTDEEFEKRLNARSKELQKQFDGLVQRRAEIDALRASVADSFNRTETEKA